MVVYRERGRLAEARKLLLRLDHRVAAVARGGWTRDAIVSVLIDAGELATAIADASSTNSMSRRTPSGRLLNVVFELACASDAMWRGDPRGAGRRLDCARRQLALVQADHLPREVECRVSEGFAYYALGPELYAEGARRWAREVRPRVVWCVGLRTIGLPLAAMAAAALHGEGIDARVCSVRPIGHPYHRYVVLPDELPGEAAAAPDAWWLVVDEGPGISGTSIAGTARSLAAAGIADDRIVLMPGYEPVIDSFEAPTRIRWARHRVVAASFDATWTATHRLRREWGADRLDDIAGGRWRDITALARERPASHPCHERRKYLVTRGKETTLLKFAGYGPYGERVTRRARHLADGGWSPAPLQRRDGWIEWPWMIPDDALRHVRGNDVCQLADYLAFVAGRDHVSGHADVSDIRQMAVTNIWQLCGEAAAASVDALRVPAAAAVHVDGRLRRHEWCRKDGRLLKMDATDHGDDHFYPGPCDIAWDVAGAIEEWQLDEHAATYLVERYAAVARDPSIAHRLSFYRTAYVAFRAAYTAFGRDQLAGTPEAARFALEHVHYLERLKALTAPIEWAPARAS